jgi:hypothetical protein
VEAFRYIVLHHRFVGLVSLNPIYNPVTFNVRATSTEANSTFLLGFFTSSARIDMPSKPIKTSAASDVPANMRGSPGS